MKVSATREAVFKMRSRVNSDGRDISPPPVFKLAFEICCFYVEGKANSEKTFRWQRPGPATTSANGRAKEDRKRERGGRSG